VCVGGGELLSFKKKKRKMLEKKWLEICGHWRLGVQLHNSLHKAWLRQGAWPSAHTRLHVPAKGSSSRFAPMCHLGWHLGSKWEFLLDIELGQWWIFSWYVQWLLWSSLVISLCLFHLWLPLEKVQPPMT
jgi:hypothetical protein